MKGLSWLAMLLVVVGALNWGLVGLFDYDLVSGIFGMGSMLTRLIFVLVGLSGVWGVSWLMPKKGGM